MTGRSGSPGKQAITRQGLRIRPATRDDTDFILSLVPRFVDFQLPRGRRKRDCIAAIHADISRGLDEPPDGEAVFIAEAGSRSAAGFLRLQLQQDFFSDARNCHISDLAVANGHDGHGIGRALLEHAHKWAKANRCQRLTLSVLPGNERARALYERNGFTTELLRMAKPLK